jgi:hypothetical protein
MRWVTSSQDQEDPGAHQQRGSWLVDRPGRNARPLTAGQKDYAEECWERWHDFDQQPGVYLRWGWVGMNCRELLTMDVQTIASIRGLGRHLTVRTGGKSFSLRRTGIARSSSPVIAEIIARRSRDMRGDFAAETDHSLGRHDLRLRELADEAGKPVLYTSGRNFNHMADANITFPDQRWLRFQVEGTRRGNAIMTGVNEAGNSVVQYRIIFPQGLRPRPNIVEIAVYPGRELTDELVLAIAISAPWLGSYFSEPSQGGG